MTTSGDQLKKGGGATRSLRNAGDPERTTIVQVHYENRESKPGSRTESGVTAVLATVRQWGQEVWIEMFGGQRGMIGWWCELVRSCGNVELWSRKASVLNRRLVEAALAANEGYVRVGLDQQRSAAHWCEELQGCLRPAAVHEREMLAASAWPRATQTARGWAMIPISAGLRVSSAWADFWSLPFAAHSGGEPAEEPSGKS